MVVLFKTKMDRRLKRHCGQVALAKLAEVKKNDAWYQKMHIHDNNNNYNNTETGGVIDFTSDAGFDWWQTQLDQQLLAYGVRVPWNDNNEFRVEDETLLLRGFGSPMRVGDARFVVLEFVWYCFDD
jgi:alpha-glucosidase (family GH31 glycosyl hydrolase)